MKTKFGFTLIELLIVISIIGLITGLLLTNVMGARERARDAKAKAELDELRKGLELYRNAFRTYPTVSGFYFYGCGTDGKQKCPVCPTADFAAGGADGCKNVFVQYLTHTGTDADKFNFRFFPCVSGDDFRLKVTLENKSDPEIAKSQLRCPAACGASYTVSSDYVVCP